MKHERKLSESECKNIAGLVRSMEDLEILHKFFSILLAYDASFLIDRLKEIETQGIGFSDIEKISPDEPCEDERIRAILNCKTATVRTLKNLRIVIQQHALNIVYEEGEKCLRSCGVLDKTKNEPWFRIMAALRNAITHHAPISDTRKKLLHKGEHKIEWSGIAITNQDVGCEVTCRMVENGAIWKLIRKMRDEVLSTSQSADVV